MDKYKTPCLNETCPVCLAREAALFGEASWRVEGGDSYLIRCLACGTVRTSPLPSDTTLENLYRTSFDYRWYQDHYDAKLSDCRIRIKEYGELLGKRVLDFGGGVGYFSKAASEAGLESVTYDPFVNSTPPSRQSWDTVVALHVLEHSNDLDRTLVDIKRFLVPGGRLILAVPNFESMGYQKLGMGWVWAQPPLVHIFHLTARGVSALLLRHGFKNIQISYCERWDANNWCDVIHVGWFKKWDSIWGVQPLNRFPIFRRLIARINSWQRYHGLQRALRGYSSSDKRYSELQVVAEFS